MPETNNNLLKSVIYNILIDYSDKNLDCLSKLLDIDKKSYSNKEKLVLSISEKYHKLLLSSVNKPTHLLIKDLSMVSN